jgi:methylated-DNA-[protein]-cysteine S-methyltransferase
MTKALLFIASILYVTQAHMSIFSEKVYSACSRIPSGSVVTYWTLARAIGHPKAFRAVGSALAKNPNAPSIPCHRVVGSDGRLCGYIGGKDTLLKASLLRAEGVGIANDRVDTKHIIGVLE